MSVTVSKVSAEFKDYIRNSGSKARFKLAIASPDRIIVSKKSFEYESNLGQILADYAANKNGQMIEGFKFEPGVTYKIAGKRYRANYIEVVIKVTDIVVCSNHTRLAKFVDEESRTCHDKNSRDRHVLEMARAINPEPAEEVEGRGEDA